MFAYLTMSKVTILNYGAGNIFSILRVFEYLGCNTSISEDTTELLQASRLVIPGVGAFGDAINKIQKNKLNDVINELNFKNIPILGICLGMQLFLDESEEFGSYKGMGLIGGKVLKLPVSDKAQLRLPNVGWESLIENQDSIVGRPRILSNLTPLDAFYFSHSYYAAVDDNKNIISKSLFGDFKFPAIIQKNNVVGFQFHPEKSGLSGQKMLKNFISI